MTSNTTQETTQSPETSPASRLRSSGRPSVRLTWTDPSGLLHPSGALAETLTLDCGGAAINTVCFNVSLLLPIEHFNTHVVHDGLRRVIDDPDTDERDRAQARYLSGRLAEIHKALLDQKVATPEQGDETA